MFKKNEIYSPLVSVIVPTYNSAEFIHKALESVLGQTYSPIELIVVDDGSTDNTYEVVLPYLKKHKEKIKFVRLNCNSGRARARNIGLAKVSGEFIAFLDADDIWLPNKLEKQILMFNRNDNIGVVGCRAIWDDGSYKKIIRPRARGKMTLEAMLQDNAIGPTSGVVIKRSIMTDSDFFDDDFFVFEDYDLWFRMAKRVQFDYVDEPLVIVIRHKNSSYYDYKLWRDGCVAFAKKHIPSFIGKERKILTRALANSLLSFHAIRFAKNQDWKECLHCFYFAMEIHFLLVLFYGWQTLLRCIFYYIFTKK